MRNEDRNIIISIIFYYGHENHYHVYNGVEVAMMIVMLVMMQVLVIMVEVVICLVGLLYLEFRCLLFANFRKPGYGASPVAAAAGRRLSIFFRLLGSMVRMFDALLVKSYDT